MHILNKLFGYTDPTRQWAKIIDLQIPTLDLQRPAFGTITFGDPVESAEHLGKPARSKVSQNHVELYYQQGFDLSFELNRLVELVVYFQASDEHGACPELRLAHGGVLLPASTKDDIIRMFGDKYDQESWEKFDILQFEVGKLIIEFELDDENSKIDFVTIYLNE